MKILFATTEAVPFCKTGGLGDVCGSLPLELAKLGHEPVVILPAFRQALQSRPADRADRRHVRSADRPQDGRRHVPAQHAAGRARCRSTWSSRRSTTIGPSSTARAATTTKTTASGSCSSAGPCSKRSSCSTSARSWSTATTGSRPDPGLSEDRTVAACRRTIRSPALLTIHNIAYQGNFWHWDMELTGLDWKYFNWRQMEFFGNLNFLKTGLVFADAISTVSPRYAAGDSVAAAGLRAGRRAAASARRPVRHHQRRRLRRVESGDRSAYLARPQLRR